MCGKDYTLINYGKDELGSPPRVREGLTKVQFNPVFREDHPRVCGKDARGLVDECVHQGSPPRVREGRRCGASLARRGRITPACAGRTEPANLSGRWLWDHPRVCGKDAKTLGAISRCGRITPACAGRTCSICPFTNISQDHPRVCGKDVLLFQHRIDQARITPACAGRTSDHVITPPWREDHPRVCGKDEGVGLHEIAVQGSPPRVREGRHRHHACAERRRITPACAGRTHTLSTRSGCRRDHPRVCGKDAGRENGGGRRVGSPPRVREGLDQCLISPLKIRITPACAGRTLLR